MLFLDYHTCKTVSSIMQKFSLHGIKNRDFSQKDAKNGRANARPFGRSVKLLCQPELYAKFTVTVSKFPICFTTAETTLRRRSSAFENLSVL